VVAKRALRYCSETWVVREEDKKILETAHRRFALDLVGVTLRE
jgi:hypothetical protein